MATAHGPTAAPCGSFPGTKALPGTSKGCTGYHFRFLEALGAPQQRDEVTRRRKRAWVPHPEPALLSPQGVTEKTFCLQTESL